MHTVTIDHNQIKEWIKERNGKPALIDDPVSGSDKVGIRIDFPGTEDEAMLPDRPITHDTDWETFFKYFDEQNLAFVIIDPPEGPNDSWAYRFVPRETLGKGEAENEK